ncbi:MULTISPECIES: thioredoxin [unclassified Luteimonas]|uniref:thioredoxin n=1 Tax=unclassified Luteimonas TaxID=2629088 RepID=UPI0016018995|nr:MULTISPECIES: thioredoxin [unclassified Luteimonas]MBB1472140.1 thioredoxin [Luteimonas sp. MC1782]MBB6599133.1 thioredoxin [Luteimonas sp. MC1825]QOC89257.1 thioredoxin [Luteimonas sp. MC1825]
MSPSTASPHVFDATADNFEADVLGRSLHTPVLIDFWAEWCGPCKTIGPILEKLAAEYNGAFVLAKIDVDSQQELAGAFQVRSIPTIILVKDGQPVDGFPGALPEGQLREFLTQHGIVPAAAEAEAAEAAAPPPPDPHAEVLRLRHASEAAPDDDSLKLELALALLATGVTQEASQLLDALPANLATDDRAVRARASLDFAALLRDAPSVEVLEMAISRDPADLRARHLLGAQHIVAGRPEAALQQFMDMLRRDRSFEDGLPRKALIEAFRVIDDDDLVARYRRQMSALLLS